MFDFTSTNYMYESYENDLILRDALRDCKSEEEKDRVDDKNLGTIKMFKRVRNYLINQYRKYYIGKEAKEFFSKKEKSVVNRFLKHIKRQVTLS